MICADHVQERCPIAAAADSARNASSSGRALNQWAGLKILERLERAGIRRDRRSSGCPASRDSAAPPRWVRTIDVARITSSLVRRQDVEQVDPVAEAVAIDRHRRRRGDPQPVAQVRLVLVRRRGHPHLEDGLGDRFGIGQLGLVLDAEQHDESPSGALSRALTHVKKIGPLDLVTDAVAGGLDAVEEREQAAFEDLADVDVAELAVEPAQQPLGLAGVLVVVAAGDLVERLAAAGHAEPDRAGEVGVEHQEADHADRLDAVALAAEIGPVGRTAPQQAGPADQLHAGRAAVAGSVSVWHLAWRIRPITSTRSRYRPSWRK